VPDYIVIIIVGFALYVLILLIRGSRLESRLTRRQDYYRNVYLKSDDWQRKRYVVLKRDNWQCVYCGAQATQVHHKRYARLNIGREPIEWLVSVCQSCHEKIHNQGGKELTELSKPFLQNHTKQLSSWKTNQRSEKKVNNEAQKIQDWLKANPTKGINDYYVQFRK